MSHTAFSEAVGEWYLGVYCRRCRAPVPVFHNPERRAVTGGTGKLTVCCPRCRKQGQYAADEMMSFLVYADRVLTAERAAVNDDHPIPPAPSDAPVPSGAPIPSGADDKPVLELGPELAVEDDEEDVELEAAAKDEPDNEPVADDSDGDAEAVLELGPELILDDDDDGQDDDDRREDGGEDAVLELGPVPALDLDQVLDDDAEVADTAGSDTAAAEDAEPALELAPGTIVADTTLEGTTPSDGEPEPVVEARPDTAAEDAAVPEPEPAPEPVAAAMPEPEPIVDAAPLFETAPPSVAQAGVPEIGDAPTDIVLAGLAARDRADDKGLEPEPIADARPVEDAPVEDVPLEQEPPALAATRPEPAPASEPVAAAALEPAPVVDGLPLLELVPDPTLDGDTEETAATPEPAVEHAAESAPEMASLPELTPAAPWIRALEPEPETDLALTTEAAAPETAPAVDAEPIVAPAAEAAPAAPEIAPKVAERPASGSSIDDIILVDWASLGEPPALAATRPEPSPAGIAPAELRASEAAPVEPPLVALEPLAPMAAEAAAPAPVVAETIAPEAAPPLPAAPKPPAPEPVAQAPIAPPPPAPKPVASKPAPPKPIAQVYRERWAEPAKRPQVIAELRPLLHGLKSRAEATDYDVLVRVTDLFLDYLADVAPARQSGVAIEQYIHAVFALSTRGRATGTDRIGEEMAATLRALNRHAGLYIGR